MMLDSALVLIASLHGTQIAVQASLLMLRSVGLRR